MPNELTTSTIECPYCGEIIEITIDCSAGAQNYIEDCQICCAPIEIALEVAVTGELTAIRCTRDTD